QVVLRQSEGEGGAAGGGLDIYRTTVLADDLLHDRQPEPGASFLAGGDERLEDPALDLFGNAGTGVGHFDHQITRRARARDPYGYLSALVADGLDRIAHQVEHGSF